MNKRCSLVNFSTKYVKIYLSSAPQDHSVDCPEVPPNRISQIIAGKRSITGDTALRFGHWFGTDPQFWLNLQARFELVQADQKTGDSIRCLPTNDALPRRDTQPRLV